MSGYRWVFNPDDRSAPHLYDVAINDDGTLRNPHGYPDELVRRGVLAADQRRQERRSNAAKKAAATRARRLEQRVYAIAKLIIKGRCFGPNQHCQVCGKAVTDQESIQRGIGSDCWQGVLRTIQAIRE
jgi:hypothetical protein